MSDILEPVEETIDTFASVKPSRASVALAQIPVRVQVVFGAKTIQVSELLALGEGSIVQLDRKIGDKVDIVVNGRIVGRGIVVVLNGDEPRFGVRLAEIVESASI